LALSTAPVAQLTTGRPTGRLACRASTSCISFSREIAISFSREIAISFSREIAISFSREIAISFSREMAISLWLGLWARAGTGRRLNSRA
jgi:hypothetical protein